MQTVYTAGGMRLPGIGRSANGRIKDREGMARAVPGNDSVPRASGWVSYVQVSGFGHPFGDHIYSDPAALSNRLRTKLKRCASIFLRRCGRIINHAPADPEKEIRQDEKAGSHAAAYRSLWHHEERES